MEKIMRRAGGECGRSRFDSAIFERVFNVLRQPPPKTVMGNLMSVSVRLSGSSRGGDENIGMRVRGACGRSVMVVE
jgi:hypothetical protein